MINMRNRKVLLVDADSKIPNLAIMKLKSYFPNANVIKLGLSAYPHKHFKRIDNSDYDQTFCSIVFQQNKDRVSFTQPHKVIIGGSGYSLEKKLPEAIDKMPEDYSVYPDAKGSYIFMTRGCPNKCWFCFVPKKEGKLYEYYDWRERIQHDRVYFLDNNFLAWDKHKDILQELIDMKLKCQFNQGLDIRKVTDSNAHLLAQLNYINEYIFAYDDARMQDTIETKLSLFNQYLKKYKGRTEWKTKFFCYIHPDMSLNEINTRVNHLRNRKSYPYIMRDSACYDKTLEHYHYYIDIANWCNQPALFKNMDFNTFITKRHPSNKKRQEESYTKYIGNNPSQKG